MASRAIWRQDDNLASFMLSTIPSASRHLAIYIHGPALFDPAAFKNEICYTNLNAITIKTDDVERSYLLQSFKAARISKFQNPGILIYIDLSFSARGRSSGGRNMLDLDQISAKF